MDPRKNIMADLNRERTKLTQSLPARAQPANVNIQILQIL